MRREGYEITARFEETHWWFVSRRALFLEQVARCVERFGQRTPGLRARILDYGCGTGFNLPFLARFGEVVGADVAEESLVEFKKEAAYPRINLRDGAEAHQKSFDVVTALDVLEHMEDDVEGLKRVLSFARPGGDAILTVPAYPWLWSGEDDISRHYRRYTKRSLLKVCDRVGAKVLFLSYFNLSILPIMAGAVWARRLADPARARATSNVGEPGRLLNGLLVRVLSFENRQVGRERWRLPAGASLICRLARA